MMRMNGKKIGFGLLLLFFVAQLLGQKEANHWIFGEEYFPHTDGFGTTLMDFNEDPPVLTYIPDYTLDYYITNACISNEEGNFLFSTNGMQIMDYTGEIIGDTISYLDGGSYWNLWNIENNPQTGGFPRPCGALFLAAPGRADEYILIYQGNIRVDGEPFHQTNRILETRLKVDINKGTEVMYKDSTIKHHNFFGWGKISASRHANGRDWWIVAPDTTSGRYHVLLYGPNGVELQKSLSTSMETKHGFGTTWFSEDGSIYIRYDNKETSFISIYDFDRCSGILTDREQIILDELSGLTCAAISPSGRFLYASKKVTELFQWDLWATDVLNSVVLIDTFDGFSSTWGGNPYQTVFGLFTPGPDGRIYNVSTYQASKYFNVILRPDEKGKACNFRQHYIQTPTLHTRAVYNYAYHTLGPIDGSPCDTLGINNIPVAKWRYELEDPGVSSLEYRFTDRSYFNPQTWHWDFDDGSTSDLQHPIHSFDKSGTYLVCLTVSNENSSDQSCQEIEVVFSSTEEYNALDQLRIFPNPVTDFLEVRLPAQTPLRLELMTLDSKTLFDPVLTCPCRISLASLPAGMYLLHVYEGKKLVRVEKLVKY